VDASPSDWAVLGAIAEGPTHGFAIARTFGPSGELGRIWTIPRPMVYQVVKKLIGLGLIRERSTQPGARGPVRTIVTITPKGRRELRGWLDQPVDHVRDVRSLFLLKLAFLDRAGRDWRPLVDAQRRRLAPRRQELERHQYDRSAGFDRILAEWRSVSYQATWKFLDSISQLEAEASCNES
jgi:PadR family transcriptional regulator AphA